MSESGSFTVDAQEFANALALIGPSTKGFNGTTPAVTIEIEEDSIVSSGTDMVSIAQIRLAVSVVVPGERSYSCEYEKLYAIISSVSGELSASFEGGKLLISGAGLNASLPVLTDARVVEPSSVSAFAEVSSRDFLSLIESVEHAAAPKTDHRPQLAAIQFSVTEAGVLTATACDGIRAAYARLPIPMNQIPLQGIPAGSPLVPAYKLKEVTPMLKRHARATLLWSESWFTIKAGDARWSCRLIGAVYPDVHKFYEHHATDPTFERVEITIDRLELAKALRLITHFRVKAGAGNMHSPVTIKTNGKSTVSLTSASLDGQVEQKLPGSYNAEHTFKCSATMLADAVNAYDSDEVTLVVTDPPAAVMVMGDDPLSWQTMAPLTTAS